MENKKTKPKSKLLTKDFVLLFVFSVAICAVMNMLNMSVPLYVTETLGSTTAMAGVMTTIYMISSCVMRPISGVLTDKFGRRVVMIIGAAIFALSVFLSGLIPSIVLLSVMRVFMGVGYASSSTAFNTASTDVMPPERLSEGIGYFGIAQNVASAFAPALCSAIILSVGNQSSFYYVAGICVVGLIVVLFVDYEKKPGYKRPVAKHQSLVQQFYEKSAVVPALYELVSLFFVSCVMIFMTLYIVSKGFDSSVAGVFFLISSIVIVLIRLLLSHLMEKLPVYVFMIPGYAALVLFCLIIPSVNSIIGIYAMALLYGIEHGLVWMALGSEAVRLAPPAKRGTANALFYLGFDLACAIGGTVWGVLIDSLGYDSCFKIVAIACAVLAVLSYPVFRKRARRRLRKSVR